MRFHERVGVGLLLGVLMGCAGEAAAPPRSPGGGARGRQFLSAEKVTDALPAEPAQLSRDEMLYAPASTPNGAALAEAPAEAPKASPVDAKAKSAGAQGGGGGGSSSANANPSAAAAEARDLVVYTAQLTMAVHQVDTGIAAVERIAKESSGYLASKKDREIVIRVPRAQFEAALAKVDRIGDVIHRDIAALDMTDEHVDLEIRIKNARSMQKHFSELLARANVKEAIEIEKELGRVTEELERLEGKLKLLNDRIAFSTITVSFEARGHTMQTQRPRLPFPWMNGLNLPSLMNLGEDK